MLTLLSALLGLMFLYSLGFYFPRGTHGFWVVGFLGVSWALSTAIAVSF